MKKNYQIQTNEKLIIEEKDSIYQVTIADIEKIYTEAGLTSIYLTGNRTLRLAKNLTYFEKELQHLGFVRINRNMLINCAYISSINSRKREVTLTTGEILTVSKRNISKLHKAIIDLSPPPQKPS